MKKVIIRLTIRHCIKLYKISCTKIKYATWDGRVKYNYESSQDMLKAIL